MIQTLIPCQRRSAGAGVESTQTYSRDLGLLMKANRYFTALLLFCSLLPGCSNPSRWAEDFHSIPPAAFLPSTAAADEQTLRFLENKVREDPDDFIAQNKLAA